MEVAGEQSKALLTAHRITNRLPSSAFLERIKGATRGPPRAFCARPVKVPGTMLGRKGGFA